MKTDHDFNLLKRRPHDNKFERRTGNKPITSEPGPAVLQLENNRELKHARF